MVKTYSIEEARDILAGVIQEAEEGALVELTRQEKPVAVLVGVEDFERLAKKKSVCGEAYLEFRRTADLSEIDPDEIFRNVRDPYPGRDVDL